MNKFFLILPFMALGACEAVQDEFYTSGGYVAPLLDQTTFPAATQREHFHRYYYIAAIAAPLALYTVSDEEGADDTIGHVARTFKQLKRYNLALKNCVEREKEATKRTNSSCILMEPSQHDKDTLISVDIRNTSYGFEVNGLEAQRNLARLATDIKNNVGLQNIGSQIDIQNPLSIIDSLVTVLRRSKDLIGPLRNFAAAYRDTIHITALSVARMCDDTEILKSDGTKAKPPRCKRYIGTIANYYNTGSSPNPIRISEESDEQQRALKVLRDNFEHVITSNELGDKGFLDDEAIKALNSIMFTSCMHAARYTEWSSEQKEKACSALTIPKFDPTEIETVSKADPEKAGETPSLPRSFSGS